MHPARMAQIHGAAAMAPVPSLATSGTSRYLFITLNDADKLDTIYNSGWRLNCEQTYRRIDELYRQCQQERKKLILLVGLYDQATQRTKGLQGFAQVANPPVFTNQQTSRFFIPFFWGCAQYAPHAVLPPVFSTVSPLTEVSSEHGRAARDELYRQAGLASVDALRKQYTMTPQPALAMMAAAAPPMARPQYPPQSTASTMQNNSLVYPTVHTITYPSLPVNTPTNTASAAAAPPVGASTPDASAALSALQKLSAHLSAHTATIPTTPLKDASPAAAPLAKATTSTLANYDSGVFESLMANLKRVQQNHPPAGTSSHT